MPNDVPVQAIRQGFSTSRIVDLIVPGPAFHRNADPSPTSPSNETDLTAGFQLGHRSMPSARPRQPPARRRSRSRTIRQRARAC